MSASPVPHNLCNPAPRLYGFEDLGLDLLRCLSDNRWSVYSIEGLGASGKTALALAVAREIVRNPDGYPYRVVACIGVRNPPLVPIGPTPASSRPHPEPHTLARICGTLGALFDEPVLLDVAKSSSSSQQFAALVAAMREHPILLVLDEVEQVVPEEEALLHEFLNAIPRPSSVLVTARRYHGFPYPTRVTWLTDDQMDAVIERESRAAGVKLTDTQRRQVRDWAHGLPFAACVALCRIQHVGLVRALADFARGPAPLVRPVIGQALSSLRRQHPRSYDGLKRLAARDIERGMRRGDVLSLLDPNDRDNATINLLAPLLRANLIVSKEINGCEVLTISPLVLWYLRRQRHLTKGGCYDHPLRT